jgi:GAF domain-containing protein
VEREEVQALAAVPLASGGSRGAVGFQFETPRAFDAEEQAFVLAVVRQCAQAIERARLFDVQKRLAERLQQLQLTAATLSAVATPRDVAAAAFRALGAIGATAAEIHEVDGPERLALVARHGRAADEAEGAVAVDAPEPAAEVVRTGRALWLESPDEITGRYPRLEQRVEHEGAWAAVPLLASGKAVGALTVAFPTPRRLEADERTFVRLVAQPCAAALERARLFEEAARSRSEAEWNADVLGAMCGAAPVGLALLDRDRRFIRVNDFFARLGGVPPDAYAGSEAAEVLPGVVAEQIEHAVRAVLDSGQAVERVVVGESHAAPGVTSRFAASAFPVRVERALVGVGLLLREAR